MGRVLDKLEVTTERIIEELARVAFLDLRLIFDETGALKKPKDWPDDVARAATYLDVDEIWDGRGNDRTQIGVTKRVKFSDKLKALELLGKHKKMFIDRVEVETKTDLADELRKARERAVSKKERR
jgi:phage terminase small subunit